MTGAFALNALLTGSLFYVAAVSVSRLIRGRAGYLLALAAFALAVAAPLGMTRPEALPAAGPRLRPEISVDAHMPLFTRAWIVGAVLLLLREIRGHVRLAHVRGRRLTSEEKARLGWPVEDDRIELGEGPPRTLASRVLVSRDLLERTPVDLAAAIVRHERAHLRWRDPVVGAVVRMVLALLWIAPPLWLLERLIRRQREIAADQEALRDAEAEEAESYAEALLRFARGASSGTAAGFVSELEHRVRRLLRGPASPRASMASLAAAFATVTAVAFVPAFRFDRPAAGSMPPPLLAVVENAPETRPATAAVGLQASRRRIPRPGDPRALPTGSGFPDFAAQVGEPMEPAADEATAVPAVRVLETPAATPRAVHRHAERDVRIDVRRHVIRVIR